MDCMDQWKRTRTEWEFCPCGSFNFASSSIQTGSSSAHEEHWYGLPVSLLGIDSSISIWRKLFLKPSSFLFAKNLGQISFISSLMSIPFGIPLDGIEGMMRTHSKQSASIFIRFRRWWSTRAVFFPCYLWSSAFLYSFIFCWTVIQFEASGSAWFP